MRYLRPQRRVAGGGRVRYARYDYFLGYRVSCSGHRGAVATIGSQVVERGLVQGHRVGGADKKLIRGSEPDIDRGQRPGGRAPAGLGIVRGWETIPRSRWQNLCSLDKIALTLIFDFDDANAEVAVKPHAAVIRKAQQTVARTIDRPFEAILCRSEGERSDVSTVRIVVSPEGT